MKKMILQALNTLIRRRILYSAPDLGLHCMTMFPKCYTLLQGFVYTKHTIVKTYSLEMIKYFHTKMNLPHSSTLNNVFFKDRL